MKPIFILGIFFISLYGKIFSQCPPPGLKIQSPVCDSPTNLRVNDINCSTIKLTWKGNKNEEYVVEAIGTDDAANTLFEIKAAEYSCDENGNCSALISVKEGAWVNWNVQSICSIKDITIYSNKVEGKEGLIPYCKPVATGIKKKQESSNTIRVYPNPTTGKLTVEYYSKIAGSIEFKIFDISGKMVFQKTGVLNTSANLFEFDLTSLLPGTYVLNAKSQGEESQVKFVILKR